MESSSLAASFQALTAADSVPAAAAASYPSWVLLDKRAHLAHHESAATKKVRTSTGQEVDISFCVAEPPAVSHFCVQIHGGEDHIFEPSVVSSSGNLVLLRFASKTGPRGTTDVDDPDDAVEFFVCKAGSGGSLSIEPVPCSPTGTRHSKHAGIVPLDGGNFLVADLSLPRRNSGHYDLHVFSSETNKWATTCLQLRTPAGVLPPDLPRLLDKVISLEGSVVGWVDLWRGIVVCDVLEKEPVLRFIQLPKTAFDVHRSGKAQKVRDVNWCAGYINFVEIEHYFRDRRKMTQDLDTEDYITDKAFQIPEPVPDGWKIRTMYKVISWDYWNKRQIVHIDDISAAQEHSALPPQLRNGGAMKWTLRNLKTTDFPFYGVYGDNVVYLVSKVESDDKGSWIVGVDLRKKKLEVIKPYCAASASSFDPTVLPCAFSEYMNTTPRSYDELVLASYSQDGVQNNHLPLDDTVPVASSAQNVVPTAHLSTSPTVPDNVQHQNTESVDGYYGRSNGSGYGAHSGYGNYQQPTPLLPPNLPPTVQPMSSSTRSASASSFYQTVHPCAFSEYMNTTPRSYDELVAGIYSQDGVLDNHLPSGDTVPVASSAQNVVPNGHLSSGSTVPDNVQHQNTVSVDGYYGRSNGSGYGAHPGHGNYQQPTPLQPQYVRPPYLPPPGQTMLSSTRAGIVFARWSDVDEHGKMWMTLPLNDMKRQAAAPLAPLSSPMPVHPLYGQPLGPSQTSLPLPAWLKADGFDFNGGGR